LITAERHARVYNPHCKFGPSCFSVIKGNIHRKSRLILLMIMKEYIFAIEVVPEIQANYPKIIEKSCKIAIAISIHDSLELSI
jgi:hypothetical protein